MGGRPDDWSAAPVDEMLIYPKGRNHVTSEKPVWLK